MKKKFAYIACFLVWMPFCVLYGQNDQILPTISYEVFPFGERGQIKMLYDRRQRPQSLFLKDKLYLVFNAGAEVGAAKQAPTKPMITIFDPASKSFSNIVTLGPGSKDHHDGPVVWADQKDHLHVLYGCHRNPGTHLVSKRPAQIGSGLEDWKEAAQIAPGISYPTFYRVADGKELIYYRTAGHISSWTYRLSDDNGQTWIAPEREVTDLDGKGRFEWSSYHCTLPSKNGRYLHVVFTAYDDNRDGVMERYYNARYDKAISNEWKYNLYYLKVDLETGTVLNDRGHLMDTPVDLDQANARCRIWDTEGRGAGVPPDIVIDQNGHPAFLHVLSEETTEEHNYYFVRLVDGKWKKTAIAPSNHQWNSCHLQLDGDGNYRAFLVLGEGYIDTEWVEGKSIGSRFEKGARGYLNTGGFMDKHGGGRIEEWISIDSGETWKRKADLTPDRNKYPGWKFNNIQPVTRVDGNAVEGMLLFYGWKDKNAPEAKAFLLMRKTFISK